MKMGVRRWIALAVTAFLGALIIPPTATAAAPPVVTVSPQASGWTVYDPTPDSIGWRFPTVSVWGSVDQCLPEFLSWTVSMTQNGKSITQVPSGALSEGRIENCNEAGGVDLGGMFGGEQLLLKPGKATVTFSVYGVEDDPLVVGSGIVTIPAPPADGKIKILPMSAPAITSTAPGTSTLTKRVKVSAVITHCQPGVTYTLSAAALPYNFARTASDSTDHPVMCPSSGHKVVTLKFYADTFPKKAPFMFLLSGPNGVNWDTRNVTIPRRR